MGARGAVAWASVILALGLAIAAAIVFVPGLLVPGGPLDASAQARVGAESEVRSTLVQLIAALIVVGGLAYTAVQVRISRETHYTDRYTKAIDQLGHEQAIVRVGAIFALKRLALNSLVDRPTVRYVLTSYLRSSAFVPDPYDHVPPTSRERLDPDVQAALTALVELGEARVG
jgi:hypothetical protein